MLATRFRRRLVPRRTPECAVKREALTRFLLVTCGVAGALMLWGELVSWRASWRFLGPAGGVKSHHGEAEAVVVLGYRDSGERANAINRWRVRAGLRSMDPEVARSWLVLCGGNVHGPHSEASLMAYYARRDCGYGGAIRLEECSRTTWENIENAIPLIEDADRIKIVSQSPHAAKGRWYLHQQRPDLAAKLVRAADYRLGEWALLKPVFAAFALWKSISKQDQSQPSAR